MLRLIFVFGIIFVGAFYALQSPFYALLLYLWNAYFRPEDWVWDEWFKSLHLSFIMGVYLVLRTAMSGARLRLGARTGLILLFLFQAIIGTLLSEHTQVSEDFLIDFVKVLLVSCFIIINLTDRSRFRLTLVVIAFSLGFECAKQGWVGTLRHPGGLNNNVIEFLGDNNGVAIGTMMLVPILGALAKTATTRLERFTWRIFAVGVFLRGIATYSRGGFLAAGALAVMGLIRAEHKVRALLIVVVTAILVSTVMPQSYWARISTIVAPADERDASQQGRLHFWGVASEMALAKPLTGVGLNGAESSYATYDPAAEFGEGRAIHSTWFGVLADLGFPGFLIFIANFGISLVSCWRVHRLVNDDPNKRDLGAYANALMTSLIIFAVGGTFLSLQYSEMLWHFIGLTAALQTIAVGQTVPARAPGQTSRAALTPAANVRA